MKSRTRPPPVWDANLMFCEGTDLGERRPAWAGGCGTTGRRIELDLVGSRPTDHLNGPVLVILNNWWAGAAVGGQHRPKSGREGAVLRETNWSTEGTTGRTREHFIHQRSRPYKLAVEPANPLRPTVPSPLLPPFWSPVLRSRSS